MKRRRIRVLSYNLHKGRSLGNLKNLLGQMKQCLRDSGAEIAFLQEVRGDQHEYLADEVWDYCSYGKNAIYRDGNHGNAILSKFPIREVDNVDLTLNRFEKRGMLHGAVEIDGWPVHLFCTHLNLLEPSRRRQLGRISEYIGAEMGGDHHAILAGDFNDWRRLAAKRLEEDLKMTNVFDGDADTHPATFPSFFPILSLDRLFHRGFARSEAKVLRGRPWDALSDHLPILADLEIVSP